MDGTVFFPLGIGLVVAALVISAVGIRGKATFPPSRGVMVGLSLIFAAIVAGTATLAVVNAKEEKDHRDEEIAEEQAHAAEEAEAEAPVAPPAAGAPAEPSAPPPGPGEASSVDVSSPEDGSLVFEPDALTAAPGTVTIVYSNPSAVPHNIAVEGGGQGGVLGETETFSAGEQELTLENIQAGAYVYFCTVPGHREGGMEGDLTVE
jgi:plastocyanin